MTGATWLPIVFVFIMALAVFVYVILDGYDLGVGILLPMDKNKKDQRDCMISSIGPFWDANETWLVLAVGTLLIAFPKAHSEILYNLYLPTALMLVSLIARGVAFDLRTKAIESMHYFWDWVFKLGSLFTALCQGYMLGRYVTGFTSFTGYDIWDFLFCIVGAFGVAAAYSLIGASWLVMKTEGELQKTSANYGRLAGRVAFAGVLLVCIINPMVNGEVFDRWFSLPEAIVILTIPTFSFLLFIVVDRCFKNMPFEEDKYCWVPFIATVLIFFFCFQGIAVSFYPYLVPSKITIWDAASAPESLMFTFIGAVIVVPFILAYTAYSYRVFWGKTKELTYH